MKFVNNDILREHRELSSFDHNNTPKTEKGLQVLYVSLGPQIEVLYLSITI